MALRKNELIDLWCYLSRDLNDNVKKQVLKVTGRGGQSAARDYISANCLLTEVFKVKGSEFNMSSISSVDDLWAILHPSTRFRLKAYTPCLAARYDELKDKEQNNLWNSGDWVCFVKGTKVRMGDNSYKEIQDIKPGEYVMGWTSNGFNPVLVTESKSPSKPKKTYTVDFGDCKVLATEDHRWWTPDGWRETKYLTEVCTQEMSKIQEDLLYGHILGDGHIDRYGNLQTAQSGDHEEYLFWLRSNLGLTWSSVAYSMVKDKFKVVRSQSIGRSLKNLRDKFYKGSVKIIPKDIKEHLSPAMFATWYMDDGSLSKSNTVHPNSRLYVNQFDFNQLKPILEYLVSLGFEFKLLEYTSSKMISFDWKSTERFCEWIADYVCPEMEYKLTCKSKFRSISSETKVRKVNVKPTSHGAVPVFCISTETENFVLANGAMVHNCTEKINGCRGWLINYKGSVHLYSRNYSDKDCGLLEYWNNIAQNSDWSDGIYAVDVEIKFEPGTDIKEDLEALGLETDSPLEAMVALLHTYPEEAVKIQEKFKAVYGRDLIVFRLIAPLYFKGKNYLLRTLGEGMDVYDECVEFGRSIGFNIKPIKRCDGDRAAKEIFLNSILDAGGEGVVFHNRKGSYCTSENRSKTSFIKLKRSVSSTSSKTGMGDQIDAFVTGFKMGSVGTSNEGLISALQLSIYINDNGKIKEHVIAVAPNIPLETKKLCTVPDASGMYPEMWTDSNGESHWVSLLPDFAGLVCEVDGQALSSKSMRMEHPRIVRWRTERSPESCIYTKEWLMSQVTNEGIKYQSQD